MMVPPMPPSHVGIFLIVTATMAGVLMRPFNLPEATWSVIGGLLVVSLGWLPAADALHAIGKGTDVFLFLIGMMLLSETARREGLFDWMAAHAVNHAQGSCKRLFVLIYLAGSVVTVFLSNDATAVVLTPAVFAVAREAKAPALPLLFICAFVANAASFVLPISNPANLVLYGDHVPSLLPWLRSFALPSVLSVAATYAALRFSQRADLRGNCAQHVDVPRLSAGGATALVSLIATAIVLTGVSALDRSLGLPTCAMGVLTAAAVLVRDRAKPWPLLKQVSWTVVPLVAGLFVLVEAIGRTGAIAALANWLTSAAQSNEGLTAMASGGSLAVASNLVNNLPAGLLASTAVLQAHPSRTIVDCLLIGVDIGPNLSITGSLATILWLAAIRREGEDMSFMRFFKVGLVVMPPALLLALGARLLAT